MTPGASSPRWWLASLLFHGALVGWLLFFSPVRVFAPEGGSRASDQMARQVIEQIRERQGESIEQNLHTLEDIRARLAELEKRKREEFLAFARETGKDAPAKATEQLKAIMQAQADALTALDQANESAGNLARVQVGAYFDDLSDAQKKARETQVRVAQLQEQIQGLLALGDTRFAKALDAQNQAIAAQERAAKAMSDAEAARGLARPSSKARTPHQEQIDKAAWRVRDTEKIINNAEANLANARQRLAGLQQLAVKLKAASEKAADTAYAAQMQKAVERNAREVTAAQRRVDDDPKIVEKARSSLPELQAQLERLLTEPPPEPPMPADPRKFVESLTAALTRTGLGAGLAAQQQRLAELQAAAHRLQTEARQAQEKVEQAIAALRDTGGAASGTESLAAMDREAPSPPPSPPAAGTSPNIAQIYEAAMRNEAALTQSYRRLRATDLAMVRRFPLARALALTDVATPVRPDLSAALQMAVRSGEDVPAARDAVQNARAETGAMVRLGNALLAEAENLDSVRGATVSSDERSAQEKALAAAVAKGGGRRPTDVSALMKGSKKGGGKGGGGTTGMAGENDGAPEGSSQGDGESSPGTASDGQPGGENGTDGLGESNGAGPFGTGTKGGVPGTNGNAARPGEPGGEGGFGDSGIDGLRGRGGRPEDVSKTVLPMPGRRVAAAGPSANYFYADSWYILGPFDNTSRRNLNQKFPPEQIIDLNATYPGKDGVRISWEFQQADRPNVRPLLNAYNAAVHDPALTPAQNHKRNLEYVIYYAYTELFFEKACDLWVAIGSDDFAKVWVEDQLVWESSQDLKAWQLNEGRVRVHFNQGVNRVLYRVENGNDTTEFSMVVSLRP